MSEHIDLQLKLFISSDSFITLEYDKPNRHAKYCGIDFVTLQSFSVYENVGARAAADDLNCRIVAGTKNMTKKEVDNCSHFRGKIPY